MSKTTDSLTIVTNPATTLAMVHATTNQTLSRIEQRVRDELSVQAHVIDSQRDRQNFAAGCQAQMQVHAFNCFVETSGEILAIAREPHSREHQTYIDDAAKRMIPELFDHLNRTTHIGVRSIMEITARPLYPEPERPRSLREKLFG